MVSLLERRSSHSYFLVDSIFQNYNRKIAIMAASEVSFNRKIISEDLSNVEFDTSEDVEVIPTFDSMGLRDELLRGIYTYGTLFIIITHS